MSEFFARLHECRDKVSLTHGLHPYPAKFIPHIPRELLRIYGSPGDTVWDPMVGSGTTLVEASVAGMPSIGTDVNPVATLVSRAKTRSPSAEGYAELCGLRRRCEQLLALVRSGARSGALEVGDEELPDIPNRDHWFDQDCSRELVALRGEIAAIVEPAARDLALVAFSAIIVPVSYQESETRWRAVRRPWRSGEALERFLVRFAACLASVREFEMQTAAEVLVETAAAQETDVADGSVDIVITSPPYANSHDYYLYNKLRLFWLGYDVAPVQTAELGSRNRHSDKKEGIETYLAGMRDVLSTARRVLRSGGRAVLVVGDAVIRGEYFDMSEEMPRVASDAGFRLDAHTAFDHRQFNASFTPGFGTPVRKLTRVLVFS